MFEIEAVAYVAVICGALLRTILPYLNKPDGLTFMKRYLGTMIAGMITSFILASIVFQTIPIPTSVPSIVLFFISMLIQGWGINDIYNKVGIDWRDKAPIPVPEQETAPVIDPQPQTQPEPQLTEPNT
jgi:branched-subunit amino acid transport protein AzlD